MVIVCLIVLVPFIAGVHPVEVLGLTWPVLVVPPVHLQEHPCHVGSMLCFFFL